MAASTTSVKVLRHPFAVVDLFAGPGGLGEGFSARRGRGKRVYRRRLSVEMDRAAHRTLTLRTFLREFDEGPPDSYHDWLSGVTDEPDWRRFYSDEWRAARKAVARLELGSDGASARLRPRVERIRRESRGRTVLLGGPPCQAYSVIGRARNASVPVAVREQDVRLTLYREFARVLGWLRPPVFVMENVKGMLSARSGGRPIFPVIEKGIIYLTNPAFRAGSLMLLSDSAMICHPPVVLYPHGREGTGTALAGWPHAS